MEGITMGMEDLGLEQVIAEIKQEFRKGQILLDEIERFAQYAQNLPRYRREKIEFRDMKRDIQHDLNGLEKVR